jgi:hypothetical protein
MVSVTRVRGRLQRLGHAVAVAAAHPADEVPGVALVDEVVAVHGGPVVHERLEGVEVDHDQVGGVLGEVAVVGDHERDRLADEADLAVGEGRHGCLLAPARVGVPELAHLGVEVGAGEHGVHAGRGEGLGGVDARDAGPGQRAAHEAGVEHPRPHDVVDEGAPSGQQAGVLDAVDTAAGVAGRSRDDGLVHVEGVPEPPVPGT